jgi:hypothetical protein
VQSAAAHPIGCRSCLMHRMAVAGLLSPVLCVGLRRVVCLYPAFIVYTHNGDAPT